MQRLLSKRDSEGITGLATDRFKTVVKAEKKSQN
jgi:hypothetical protein